MRMESARTQIVEFGRRLVTARLTTGTGGNLSFFDRKEGLVAIKPSGVDYFEMKPEDVASILKDATPLTPNTLVDPAKVEERLRVVRTRGYEMSSAEREQGVSSVAVPIFDASNMPVACLTVSGPIPRFTESMVAELVPAAIESARAISLRLGAELGDGTTLPRPQDD